MWTSFHHFTSSSAMTFRSCTVTVGIARNETISGFTNLKTKKGRPCSSQKYFSLIRKAQELLAGRNLRHVMMKWFRCSVCVVQCDSATKCSTFQHNSTRFRFTREPGLSLGWLGRLMSMVVPCCKWGTEREEILVSAVVKLQANC